MLRAFSFLHNTALVDWVIGKVNFLFKTMSAISFYWYQSKCSIFYRFVCVFGFSNNFSFLIWFLDNVIFLLACFCILRFDRGELNNCQNSSLTFCKICIIHENRTLIIKNIHTEFKAFLQNRILDFWFIKCSSVLGILE